MNETNQNFFERSPEHEHIPSAEEVHAELKEIIGQEYTEVRKIEDEQGLIILEVVVPGENEGDTNEYAYMRKGKYQGSGITETNIHVTYYSGGQPISGTNVARYIDGKWKIVK
jgi:hypothetical protein